MIALMNMRILTAVLSVGLAGSVSPLLAQANPRGEAKVSLAGKAIAIEYGRPSLKGRDMLGQAPVGKSWRMGADSATTLKTEAELAFGSTVVPKGEYTLTATKLDAGKWQLNVADKDKATVAEIPLEPAPLPAAVETFTIELAGDQDKGVFSMSWGNTALKAPFTAK
jgi:hypothetical protein